MRNGFNRNKFSSKLQVNREQFRTGRLQAGTTPKSNKLNTVTSDFVSTSTDLKLEFGSAKECADYIAARCLEIDEEPILNSQRDLFTSDKKVVEKKISSPSVNSGKKLVNRLLGLKSESTKNKKYANVESRIW